MKPKPKGAWYRNAPQRPGGGRRERPRGRFYAGEEGVAEDRRADEPAGCPTRMRLSPCQEVNNFLAPKDAKYRNMTSHTSFMSRTAGRPWYGDPPSVSY